MQTAAAPPYQDAPPQKSVARDAGVFARFKLQILGAVFLQRIGLNAAIGGQSFPLPVTMFLTPLVVFWNLFTGAGTIARNRLTLYLGFIVAITISTIAADGGSIFSLFLVAGIYAMFVFPVALDEPGYKRFFRLLANTATIICVLGSLQYAIQYVWSPNWLFSWRQVVPPQILIEFNTLNMIQWPNTIYKANGFFLMEASYQSQMAARALLISIFILRDFRYLPALGLGLVTAYSGTGIVLFLIFGALPLLIVMMRNSKLKMFAPVGLLLAPLVVLLLWDQLNLSLFIDRLGEFTNPRSSGYARFVTSQMMFKMFSESDFVTLLFGAGPGATDGYLAGVKTAGESFASTWIKLILDYGLIGFATFLAFFYTCMKETLRSHWLAVAFSFHFFVLDGGFAVPQQAFMSLLLGGFVVLRAANSSQPQSWAPAPGPRRAPAGPQAGMRT